MNVCAVGGNAVSAFLSWRLQATNACDVTLVWKSGFDSVAQYGISFKSTVFGNERFKPRHVVRAPEEAANTQEGPFDYVLLCVKALPDVYDLAAVIESVVTPQHTCILLNTTSSLGIEDHIEERFPSNVVLSLVSGAELTQLGASEFEHKASTEIWVGPANKNPSMPSTIQGDMAEALAVTLSSGQVNCHVSTNIRQQQYERMIGPIAFHPASVIFETPSHVDLYEKLGAKVMISGILDELIALAKAQGCSFPSDFKQKTINDVLHPHEANSIMYQDFVAKRPMEVETYLGSPMKLADRVGVKVPRIETLYAILHSINTTNQQRKEVATPVSPATVAGAPPPPRLSSRMGMTPPVNGNGAGRGGRASSMGPPPNMRRGPPISMNGGRPPNGYGRPMPPPNGYQSRNQSRRGSMDGNDLEEFSHLVLYDDIPESTESTYGDTPVDNASLRERELMLRERELALKEQELRTRRGPIPLLGRRPKGPGSVRDGGYDDDDDEDGIDPQDAVVPLIDPDNFDMMSVTSRRNRKAPPPNPSLLRKDPEYDPSGRGSSRMGFNRPVYPRNRSSARIISATPTPHDNIMEDPLLAYSSNRYGNVDRAQMGQQSRTNSLTAAQLDHMANGHAGPMSGQSGPYPRRVSQSPNDAYSPQFGRGNGRPSPPNGYGPPMNGRPSPPGAMRQPVPRHPPGQGNAVAPQQVEQYAGVSALNPPKGPVIRSLTGSASASAESGDSGASANIDSEPSANSSQSSLGPRPPIGVR
ncbi:hypothetical protein B7463_g3750, partial [Scytalidium lignicola]